jgi:hypothetical protein
MSGNSAAFNANQRLAEVALWVDAGAGWIDRTTDRARAGRSGRVAVAFERAELGAAAEPQPPSSRQMSVTITHRLQARARQGCSKLTIAQDTPS